MYLSPPAGEQTSTSPLCPLEPALVFAEPRVWVPHPGLPHCPLSFRGKSRGEEKGTGLAGSLYLPVPTGQKT